MHKYFFTFELMIEAENIDDADEQLRLMSRDEFIQRLERVEE